MNIDIKTLDELEVKVIDRIEAWESDVRKYLSIIEKKLFSFLDSAKEVIDKRIIRYLTYPGSWFIFQLIKWIKTLHKNRDLTCKPGIHIHIGGPGTGKTLGVKRVMDYFLDEYGYASWINYKFEKPKVDEEGTYYNHAQWAFDDLYGVKMDHGKLVGYQKYKLPYHYFKIRVADENHLTFYTRMNRTNQYNLIFKPYSEDLVVSRQEDCVATHIMSQITPDVILMSLSDYVHYPETIKDLDYRHWLETGRIEIIPIKIKYETHKWRNGKLNKKKVWSARITTRNLEDFDSHALRNNRKHIPNYKPTFR